MQNPVLITGNQHKADALAKWLGLDLEHQRIDLAEIQSLDLHEVATDKAKRAFEIVNKTVLVEDVSLEFTALGKLPGTFIKWFLKELDLEGLCRLADGLSSRQARCAITYALYDGKIMQYFEAEQHGTVADHPKGDHGFGWNAIFTPEGSELTYGEMDEAIFEEWNIRAHAVAKLRTYLTKT